MALEKLLDVIKWAFIIVIGAMAFYGVCPKYDFILRIGEIVVVFLPSVWLLYNSFCQNMPANLILVMG
jgi:hypothetical protein